MTSTNAHKAKQDTSGKHRRLTQYEIESLQQEMRHASDWMKKALVKRRETNKKT
ncbi:hypothetical protein [Salicola sp. Rm-C-2C1-2]|uniref:hypothetical protein n=1 Tax=Salicola sp. Rm-C-2C1-2 TaxID=3141321 RepID=UPI0032E48595